MERNEILKLNEENWTSFLELKQKVYNDSVKIIKSINETTPESLDISDDNCVVTYNGGAFEKEDFYVTMCDVDGDNIVVHVEDDKPFYFNNLTMKEQLDIVDRVVKKYKKLTER